MNNSRYKLELSDAEVRQLIANHVCDRLGIPNAVRTHQVISVEFSLDPDTKKLKTTAIRLASYEAVDYFVGRVMKSIKAPRGKE